MRKGLTGTGEGRRGAWFDVAAHTIGGALVGFVVATALYEFEYLSPNNPDASQTFNTVGITALGAILAAVLRYATLSRRGDQLLNILVNSRRPGK